MLSAKVIFLVWIMRSNRKDDKELINQYPLRIFSQKATGCKGQTLSLSLYGLIMEIK